ncbi:putative ribonuclease H-like domain-containing protein, partial [Tanacetum coccineum]
MAHVNFKNINKLAKHGLVNRLPSKLFTNEYSCVACNKGKEHKASYKAITAGIKRDYSNAITPQQNGVAERKNRTLIEAARTMLVDSKLPTMFWTEAVSTACYVMNRVLGLGQEWYFDLDYLTDSLGYTRFKSNQPAGTQDPNIHAGTQDDSDSECDEQVIVVSSFPSNSFSGPKVYEASQMMESNSDYAEELAWLQRQEHEANDTAEKYGFSKDTEERLRQADMVPAGSIDPAASIPAGSIDPAASIPTGSIDPTASISTGTHEPFPTVIEHVYADATSLPPGHSLGSSEHSTRFPSPSDLANSISSSLEMEDIYHHPCTGIFSSSSYDDDFGGIVTNLAPSIVVDSVPTKRVNTIHPQSHILGDLTSPVQARDYLHCLFACFLSQLEPSSVAQALNDPAWIEAMQEEMQQFVNQEVWKLVPLPDGKIAIGTKWILKNKRDSRGIVVKNKARLVAQGHRQEEGIDYDEVFAPAARIEAIKLFLAFASYMGFM